MPTLPYDPSREALLDPGRRERPVLGHEIGAGAPLPAIAAECARLAYLPFETPASPAREQLGAALAAGGYPVWAGFDDAATHTQAFAALPAAGPAVLAFRGTQPDVVTDIASDLAFSLVPWAGGGKVHVGFATAFNAVAPAIDAWLAQHAAGRGVVVTGHSLGGALATLAASRWRSAGAVLCSIGAPRVGDAAFVATLDLAASHRYVDCCDAVTQLPPALPGLYADSGPAIYIDAAGSVRPGLDPGSIDADRDAARRRYQRDLAWVRGNVWARDLADHAPINYVRAFT